MTLPSTPDSSDAGPDGALSRHDRPGRASGKSALAGALVGMTALAGTLVGVGAIASAQDDPAPATPPAEIGEANAADTPTDESTADWEAFETCMAGQLGDLWAEPEILFDEGDMIEGEFVEAVPWEPADEQKFVEAEEQCNDLLPEDVQAEMEAWDAFDECLNDAGVFDEGDIVASSVHIETGDGFQVAEFGEIEGSVTVSGTDGNLTVTATGGVTLLDENTLDAEWAAFDEAHQACESLLPDVAFGLPDLAFDDEG